MSELQVDLVAADRTVWSGAASFVRAKSVRGDLGILPGHSPVLAVLAEGDVEIDGAGSDGQKVAVTGGFMSVEHDKVVIVVDLPGDRGGDRSGRAARGDRAEEGEGSAEHSAEQSSATA